LTSIFKPSHRAEENAPMTESASTYARPRSAWRDLRGVLVLNAVLLALLAAVTFGSRADAQNVSRSNYNMVAGNAAGANAAVVYIADAANAEMVVVTYNPQQKVLEGVGYTNFAADAARLSRPR
jgi:hypothetical protein